MLGYIMRCNFLQKCMKPTNPKTVLIIIMSANLQNLSPQNVVYFHYFCTAIDSCYTVVYSTDVIHC